MIILMVCRIVSRSSIELKLARFYNNFYSILVSSELIYVHKHILGLLSDANDM